MKMQKPTQPKIAPKKVCESRARKRFGAFLERNGLSYAAAGRALGVSHVAVYEWVLGTKRPTPGHREAIAVWTDGDVLAVHWRMAGDRDVVAGVKPFQRTG